MSDLPTPDDLPVTEGPPSQDEPEGQEPGGPLPVNLMIDIWDGLGKVFKAKAKSDRHVKEWRFKNAHPWRYRLARLF